MSNTPWARGPANFVIDSSPRCGEDFLVIRRGSVLKTNLAGVGSITLKLMQNVDSETVEDVEYIEKSIDNGVLAPVSIGRKRGSQEHKALWFGQFDPLA